MVRINFEFLPTVVVVVVMLCWFGFAGVFLGRRKPPSPPDRKRDRGSLIGVALQLLSYPVVWAVPRPAFTPVVSNRLVSTGAAVLAMVSAVASVCLVASALKTLGREWSITARLVEGHKLATKGPYAYVRHPIYTAMLGMLIANGLAVSHWIALVVALLVFFIGTIIRVRSEDRLLREAFGEQFDEYAQRVPAIVPGLF